MSQTVGGGGLKSLMENFLTSLCGKTIPWCTSKERLKQFVSAFACHYCFSMRIKSNRTPSILHPNNY